MYLFALVFNMFDKYGTVPVSSETSKEFREPVFLNVYRAQESIPGNEFRLPM